MMLENVVQKPTRANWMQQTMERLKIWARTNSIWLVHFNSGSCNGCDIEILATLTPRYDLERLGVRLHGQPAACGCFDLHWSGHTPGTRAIATYL